MFEIIFCLVVGFAAGVFGGLFGIGGGMVTIPILVYLGKMPQQVAQGTTLGMLLPPIGFLSTYVYWKHGCVNVKMAALLAIGAFFGGFFGAKLALYLPTLTLKRLFGFVLLFAALRMILGR
jgi:uncharacterized membrane protein YfcA